MRIQHNIAALNAYRNLTNNNSAVSKNLEKLSSGYRINRAGDDAAGLAISEKMRAQITGLETAQKNANDGISLVQTAEGALTEVHSMLNRMVELANQSANGTYANQPDRENLQAEIDSLLDEIDRISQATNFNGINLLDGSLGLDKDTFSNLTTTGEQLAAQLDGSSSALAVSQVHSGAGVTAVKPYFEIDLKDVSFKVENSGSTAGTVTWGLSVGGTAVQMATGVTAGSSFNAVSMSNAATAGTTVTMTATTIGGLLNGKVAKIGNDVFSMVTSGTKVQFTYIGTMDGTKYKADTNGDTVTSATLKPNQTISFTASGDGTNATATNAGGRVDCNMLNVTDPVVGESPVRTGFRLQITEDIINAGSLKIGNTTFTFDKDSTATVAAGGSTATAVTIGIKGKSGSDLVKYVTEQMSHASLTMNAEDSASTATFTFNVGRVENNDAMLEFEEAVPTAASGPYANFSLEYIQSQVTQSRGHANATSSVTINEVPTMGQSIKFGDTTYVFGGKDSVDGKVKGVKMADTAASAAENLAAAVGGTANGNTVTVTAPNATPDKVAKFGSAGLMLQIGDTSDDYNRMTVDVRDMSTKALGIADIDISTQGGAQMAVDKIKQAINDVSSQRGDLGAIQNRLEHTINNLSVTAENMTAAESRIRDVDMAEEMMAYTKNNILVQAAQAMLAQANQVPQGVLQLLQ